jgi:5-methylcytosine-specific restriction endonuclease McrA
MNHSKLELQQMLREMGVKFSHTESYENLKRLFQQENHSRWMRASEQNNGRAIHSGARIIRKRRVRQRDHDQGDGKEATVADWAVVNEPLHPKEARHHNAGRESTRINIKRWRRHRTTAKPREKIPPVMFERHRDVFKTAKKRARNRCELCGASAPSKESKQAQFLHPFHIEPLANGGPDSIKNVVALCQDCHARISVSRGSADIKTLKRKARGKILPEVVVIKK